MNRKKATDVSPNLPQFPVGGKNMPLMHNKKNVQFEFKLSSLYGHGHAIYSAGFDTGFDLP